MNDDFNENSKLNLVAPVWIQSQTDWWQRCTGLWKVARLYQEITPEKHLFNYRNFSLNEIKIRLQIVIIDQDHDYQVFSLFSHLFVLLDFSKDFYPVFQLLWVKCCQNEKMIIKLMIVSFHNNLNANNKLLSYFCLNIINTRIVTKLIWKPLFHSTKQR